MYMVPQKMKIEVGVGVGVVIVGVEVIKIGLPLIEGLDSVERQSKTH